MVDIKNEEELQIAMVKAAEEAIKNITEEVLEIFKKNYIQKYIYNSHPSNKMYERTYEFENAWNWTDIKLEVNKLSTEMWYNPDLVHTFNTDTFTHGSIYSSPPDVRDNLPSILEGKRSSLWISVSRPIKFWQQFIGDMLKNGELEKIVQKHFIEKGFIKI